MKVFEHNNTGSFPSRSHPWIGSASDPEDQYCNFREKPELIRSSIEDMQKWSAYAAAETFYRLLEWLNGSESVFESNDCAFNGASTNTSVQCAKPLECSGRLMILYRDLEINRSQEEILWLTNAAAHGLRNTDPSFEWGAIGATIMPVRFTALSRQPAGQRGQQVMLSFWAWGEDEAEVMANLDRTFRNMTAVLHDLSGQIRRPSPSRA